LLGQVFDSGLPPVGQADHNSTALGASCVGASRVGGGGEAVVMLLVFAGLDGDDVGAEGADAERRGDAGDDIAVTVVAVQQQHPDQGADNPKDDDELEERKGGPGPTQPAGHEILSFVGNRDNHPALASREGGRLISTGSNSE